MIAFARAVVICLRYFGLRARNSSKLKSSGGCIIFEVTPAGGAAITGGFAGSCIEDGAEWLPALLVVGGALMVALLEFAIVQNMNIGQRGYVRKHCIDLPISRKCWFRSHWVLSNIRSGSGRRKQWSRLHHLMRHHWYELLWHHWHSHTKLGHHVRWHHVGHHHIWLLH